MGDLAKSAMLVRIAVGVLSMIAAFAGASCTKSEDKEPAPAASAPTQAPAGVAVAEGEQIFSSRCVSCHGPEGKGNGPASAGLTPPPRDFTDPAWQDSVTDEHIEQIIKYGGVAVGKSPMMPANPDLTAKPEVISALRAHIRALRGQ